MCSQRNAGSRGPATLARGPKAFFDLWDLDSMNSLGTYNSQDEVIAIVRSSIQANGIGYADLLDVSIEDEEGNIEHVATGDDLLTLIGLEHRTGTL